MPPREHVQSLLRDLEHGSHAAQLEAVHHLRRMAYPEVAEAMIRKLRASTWTDVRAEVASCLDAFEDARAVAALLSVLNEESEIRDAALASLRRLVEADTLLLLRLTRAQPDPDIRQEAARGAPGRRLDPVQRWATAILTDLRAHGTPEAIPKLITVLEHEKTDPRYLSLVVEALVGIAGRHPHVDLRSAYVLVQKHALTAPSATKHREILRPFETLTGATLPRPAAPSPAHGPELPIPATAVPSIQTAGGHCRPYTKTATSPAKMKQSVAPAPSARGDLICDSFVTLFFLATTWGVAFGLSSAPSPTLWISSVAINPMVIKLLARLVFSLRQELPTEIIRCEDQRLTVLRRLGPWRWSRNVVLPLGGRIHCVTQKPPGLWRLFVSATPTAHVACLGTNGRPFRFAYSRTPEEVERLVTEINAYLEHLEARPKASTGTEHPTDTNSCVAVSRTVPEPTGPVQANRHAR